MWTSLASLVLIAYLPGALVLRLPLGERERRARLSAEERWFWAVMISVVTSSVLALGLAAAGRYSGSTLMAVQAGVCLAIVGWWRGRLKLGAGAARPTWSTLIPLGLVLLGGWLYLHVRPPAEYVIGGKDPGVYISEGIQIAQRGGLTIRDPLVARVPTQSRDLFFPSHDQPSYYGLRFMGFFVLDPDTGAVSGQFPHLAPVWIAIGYDLNGLTGARQATAAWAILGLLAVYFAGAHLLGRPAAAAGALLLAGHVLQIWFARYPNSEMPMQALLFAGLLAHARAQADDDAFFAGLAAALVGLLPFLRISALLAIAAVGAATVLGVLRRPRLQWTFLAPLALWGAAACVYLLVWMGPYSAYPVGFLLNLRPIHVALLVTAGLGLLGFLLLGRRPAWASRLRTWLPRALACLALGGVAYAYFLRTAGGALAPHDADALRTFSSFYLSPYGLIAAVVGFALVMARGFWRSPALLLATCVFAGFFFYKIRIVPEHFWMARRFIPVILPMALQLASAAALTAGLSAGAGGSLLARRTTLIRLGIGVVFLALLGRQFLAASRPIVNHVEYAGLIPRIEGLAATFGDEDLVLVEARNASDLHVLALPLAYIYARQVLVLDSPRPDKPTLVEFIAWARSEYQDVYFIGGGGTDLLSRSIGVEAIRSERFQVPEYASTRDRYPRGVQQKEFEYSVYRLTDPSQSRSPFTLDLGTADDLHVVRFHAKEQLAASGLSFRWTQDASLILLQVPRTPSRQLTIWMQDGGRPPDVTPAHVDVFLNERQLGTARVGSGFEPFTFEIPPALAAEMAASDAPAELRLETGIWIPRQVLGVPDDRELGVMVDRVEVR